MANTDNTCSNLEINGIYDSSKNIIEDIYNLQATTQRNVYNYTFETMNLRALMEFWHMNNHALLDEVLETLDALGGIKDGVGSLYWTDLIEVGGELSDNDLIELKFELIDQLHFIMNMWVSINGDSKILDEMYTNMYGPLKMTGTNKLEDVDHTEHLLFGLKMTSAIHNATDSLGGKSVGGNAIWKRWKAKYANYETMYYSELSDEDKMLVENNIVLVMGLFFKYCNSIGLYGEEIYNMYMSKNIENIRRQNDGY